MDTAGASLAVARIHGVANFAVRAVKEPPAWVVYAPLPPLFLLLFTGLYLFVLPHAARRRGRQPS